MVARTPSKFSVPILAKSPSPSTLSSFKCGSKERVNKLPHIVCANVRSALGKTDDIYATVCSQRVHIFAATETWLHDGIDDSLISFPNFHHHRCDRESRRGGGVCSWTHSSLNAKPLVSTHKPDFVEAVWLCLPYAKIIFTCMYIPPDFAVSHSGLIDDYIVTNVDNFLSYLCDFDVIICGDFNKYDVQDICNQLDLDNMVQEPTRISAFLDYILISKTISASYHVSVESPISNSDHRSICAYPKAPISSKTSVQRTLYDLRESNVTKFIGALSMVNWTPFYLSSADLDDKCDFLHDLLSEMVKSSIPTRTVSMTESDKPWMTPMVKHAIQMIWNAYRQKNFALYQHWKRKVKVLITKAKKQWSSKAKISSKGLWSVARSETGTKSKNSVYSLINSFESVTSAVNAINDKFSSVFAPDSPSSACPPEKKNETQWSVDISVESVEKRFSAINANKAMGYDGIPTILYKRAAKHLAGPFAHLFNLSVKESRFPRRWKHALVCPIPKCSPPDLEQLRPISLLPVPAKIFERIVLQSVQSKFIDNFGNNQFGCRPSSSTTCAVISLTNHALNTLEAQQVSGMKIITYDLTKAFDKLSHSLIIKKLYQAGFPTKFVNWTQSYLCDRSQGVKIGCTTSAPTAVVSGVPQGSVLGPMYFCLTVGNLNPIHNTTKLIQYVDDITLSIPLYRNEVNSHVIDEHHKIVEWANDNGFIVNSRKCQSLLFAKVRDIKDIHLMDVPTVEELKFLGVLLNNKLNWTSHVKYICRQASRRIYALRILKPIFNTQELLSIYNGAVRSLLEYASPAFGKLPKNLDEEVNKVQRRCHRIICEVPSSRNCHCKNFEQLSKRRESASIKLFTSAVKNKTHILHHIMPAKSHRSTRFILPPSSTTRLSNSFVHFTAATLNGNVV